MRWDVQAAARGIPLCSLSLGGDGAWSKGKTAGSTGPAAGGENGRPQSSRAGGGPHNRRGAGGGPAQKSSPSRQAVRVHVLTRGNPGCLGK